LQHLKHDARLLEQVDPLPHSGRKMRAEPPDRWQVRWALFQRDPQLLVRFYAFQRQLTSLPRRARRWLMRKAALTLSAAALLLALSGTPLAYAASTIAVTTNIPDVAADRQCSLIEAIDNANADAATHADCAAGSGADTITLPAGSTINLTGPYNDSYYHNGLPKITSQLTIEGNGSTIQGDDNAPNLRILMVDHGDLTLNNTTISGGRTPAFNILGGPGILNIRGNLTLNHSTVSGNMVGGGIQNNGQLTLNNSIVNGNTGGGIFNLSGTVTLNESTVSGNSSTQGGGITNFDTLILNDSTVSGNSLINMELSSIIFDVGDGAGIWTGFSSTLTLNNSTVSGNTINGTTPPDSYEVYAARGSGIFSSYGTVTLQESTVTGNSISSSSGGTLGLSGGGIYMAGGTLNLSHSLVSGNAAQNDGDEISAWTGNYNRAPATINSNDFNLIGHDGNAGTRNFTPSGSDIVPSQPLSAILGPLADNGGPTLTHALLMGSPAVDAAPTGPATDQRGISRPQGPAFDIGAFELEQQALFNFSGFFQPVDNLPTLNTVKAGAGVPVKFSLGGNQGLAIFAAGSPISQQVACAGGLPVDDIEQTVTAGASTLSYDSVTDTYTYVWKTNSSWKGQCRTLIVKLSDGTEHKANFKFK
jgi:hypothetical protein